MSKINQLFDERNCMKNNCKHLFIGNKSFYCYAFPEDCKINKKAGYPKEVVKCKRN
jgi:hypothetical protein